MKRSLQYVFVLVSVLLLPHVGYCDQKVIDLTNIAIKHAIETLEESTSTWSNVQKGLIIPGFNFDENYTSFPLLRYRLRFSKGQNADEAIINAEGLFSDGGKLALQVTVKRQSIPGVYFSENDIRLPGSMAFHWGPIVSPGNIVVVDRASAHERFPHKFAGGVVSSLINEHPRDDNGSDLPNTDGLEWWSQYPITVPQPNFAVLRASAAATQTLNVYGCNYRQGRTRVVNAPWSPYDCNVTSGSANHSIHFQNSFNHPLARQGHNWYWDRNVIFTGDVGAAGNGIQGNVIVRGNLTNFGGDNYSYTGAVPADAWKEYVLVTSTQIDTLPLNQYPADNGYQTNRMTFSFGGETWSGGPTASNTDVGLRGLLYVGQDLVWEGSFDINGAIWVNGNIASLVGLSRVMVFFDDTLNIPTLNVVLKKISSVEVPLSAKRWFYVPSRRKEFFPSQH